MNTRHLDAFVGLRRAPDLLALRLFPNAKEVTETMGAHAAVRDHLHPDVALSDPDVLLLAVGDGHSPRTGAAFALMSAWMCFSVDPLMRVRFTGKSLVPRLVAVRARIEDAVLPGGFDAAVVVAVHSHAGMAASVRAAARCARRVYAVSIPCCVPSDLPAPHLEYEDQGVLSPHRRVQVWKPARAVL